MKLREYCSFSQCLQAQFIIVMKVYYSKWWGVHADRESLANMATMNTPPLTRNEQHGTASLHITGSFSPIK